MPHDVRASHVTVPGCPELGCAWTLSWASTHNQVDADQPVGVGLGTGVADPGEPAFAPVVELGLAVTIGVGLSLPHTLPAGTWQSAGATIRGSDGLNSSNESATVTSD